MALVDRFKHAYNAFLGRDPTPRYIPGEYSYFGGSNPSSSVFGIGKQSILDVIFNQIAVDCSTININHVRLNKDRMYEETIDDSLNQVLTIEANIDQTGRDLIRDAVMTLLNEGVIAIVPVDTDVDPDNTDSYKVETARVGKIIGWMPRYVRVELYNDITGQREELVIEKRLCAVVENPFYAIMNTRNSTTQRLLRVLSQLDSINEQTCANKLDLIIQLPFSIKSEARRVQAETRRKEIEAQLTSSQFGIAYIDSTERVIQLNRSLENNLWNQAKDLQTQLFNQFGLCQAIFDGTADEQTMLNYYNRTIEPILSAITEEMQRKWLSPTARAQGQAIRFYRDPFKLVPVAQFAEIADKLTRNCIMTSNELRAEIGLKPSKDPNADKLINSNLNQPEENKQSNEQEETSDDDKKAAREFINQISK